MYLSLHCVSVCVTCVYLPPHHHSTNHRKSGRGRGEVDHGAVNLMTSRAASWLAAARRWRVYKPCLGLSCTITEQQTTSREKPGDKLKERERAPRSVPAPAAEASSTCKQGQDEYLSNWTCCLFTVHSVFCSAEAVMRGGIIFVQVNICTSCFF